ncbi:hypothetical protein JOE59_001297 [Agromyces cerinus]|nr:hypothetical protein [Agromyces cerinus]
MDVQPIDPAAIDLPVTKSIDITASLREALVSGVRDLGKSG